MSTYYISFVQTSMFTQFFVSYTLLRVDMPSFITTASPKSKHNDGPLTPNHDIQQGWGNTITMATVHSRLNTPIQGMNHYKPEPYLYIAYWLSKQTHAENKDSEIRGKKLRTDAFKASKDIPTCRSFLTHKMPPKRMSTCRDLRNTSLKGGHSQEMRSAKKLGHNGPSEKS